MERVRAALLGCLLAGGVIFGARPIIPDDRGGVRPTAVVAGPGPDLGRTPDDLARWLRPLPPGALFVVPPATPRVHRHSHRRSSCGRAGR